MITVELVEEAIERLDIGTENIEQGIEEVCERYGLEPDVARLVSGVSDVQNELSELAEALQLDLELMKKERPPEHVRALLGGNRLSAFLWGFVTARLAGEPKLEDNAPFM